jgi:alcohol dehydrogenase class IV
LLQVVQDSRTVQALYQTAGVAPVLGGPGALAALRERLVGSDFDRIVLISDEGIAAAGLVERVIDRAVGGARVEVFLAPAGEPCMATVEAAADRVRATPQPAVIGLGGGSALDVAKLAAALAGLDAPLKDRLLGAYDWPGQSTTIAVPTTAGTGSEATRTCVISDDAGRKLWAWGDALLPALVVLEPELTCGLPAPLTAATGIDAFVHAVEAASSRRITPLARAAALEAVRRIAVGLPRAARRPGELAARQLLQEAAHLAGVAIDAAGTGPAHALGHALGSLYGVPHGVAVGVGLRASLGFSLEAGASAFAEVARCLDPGAEPAALPELVDRLYRDAGFDAAAAAWSDLEVDSAELAACMQAEENRPMAHNGPRSPDGEDWERLARSACAVLRGDAPAEP